MALLNPGVAELGRLERVGGMGPGSRNNRNNGGEQTELVTRSDRR